MLFCSYIFCNKTFSKCLWSSKNCNMALLFAHFVFNTCEANPYCSYIYAEKVSSRPRFIAPHYQVAFTLLLCIIPLLLTIISLIVVPPKIREEMRKNATDHNSFPEIIVTCSSPKLALIILQMIYLSCLLIASNSLAIMTIQISMKQSMSPLQPFLSS